MQNETDADLVRAARAGDPAALDELIAHYLPLVYNIVGRALGGHADVDDVVQETMLRVVNGLPALRDPAAFRSWLVAIAIHEVRDRWRRRRAARGAALDEAYDLADPGADFVDLTIVRLGLSGQRRQVAEATRWLDADDRELLSLWWLEAAGELTRTELAGAVGLTPQHAAVRVQRMKAQLETARAIVRALWSPTRCAELDRLTHDWDGLPSALWRKRLARHVRECDDCSRHLDDMVPAERLLAGLALVPLAAGSGLWAISAALHSAGATVSTSSNAAATSSATVAATPNGPSLKSLDGTAPATAHPPAPTHVIAKVGARHGGHLLRIAIGKPVIAAVAVTAVGVTGGAYALTGSPAPTHTRAATASPPPVVSTAPVSPLPSPSPSPSATSASASASGSPSPTATGPVYGQTVDTVDVAPPVNRKPGALPHRPDGTIAVSGNYSNPFVGSLGGKYLLFFNNQYVTITGRGYFRVRWEVAYFNRAPGQLRMPTWTGLTGKLFHVASGGGRRMDDEVPGTTDPPHTWMGRPDKGYDTLPPGTQQMWQNEYYYLDGSVTVHENENYADYNISVTPMLWSGVVNDIDTAPRPSAGFVRYGLVRDTGDDGAPVPQYVTREVLGNLASVPVRSRV